MQFLVENDFVRLFKLYETAGIQFKLIIDAQTTSYHLIIGTILY